jgi:hypothetical protein
MQGPARPGPCKGVQAACRMHAAGCQRLHDLHTWRPIAPFLIKTTKRNGNWCCACGCSRDWAVWRVLRAGHCHAAPAAGAPGGCARRGTGAAALLKATNPALFHREVLCVALDSCGEWVQPSCERAAATATCGSRGNRAMQLLARCDAGCPASCPSLGSLLSGRAPHSALPVLSSACCACYAGCGPGSAGGPDA